MFNEFNISNEEILKILESYNPLILDNSKINFKFDEDLYQEIRLNVFKELSKNRKKFN